MDNCSCLSWASLGFIGTWPNYGVPK